AVPVQCASPARLHPRDHPVHPVRVPVPRHPCGRDRGRGRSPGDVAGAAPRAHVPPTRYSFSLDLSHSGVRDVMRLAGPRTLALGAVQIVFFVDTYLASGMPEGSLTALVYANQLLLLPLGVFSIAISAAVFPTLSHYASL